MASLFWLAASQLLFHLWRARLLYSRLSPYAGGSIQGTNDSYIYSRHVCRALLLSCFRKFAIRRAMGTSGSLIISNSRPLSVCERGEGVGSAFQCISGMPEIDFGVSDLPISLLDFRPGVSGTCLPIWFDGSLSPLVVKGNGWVYWRIV